MAMLRIDNVRVLSANLFTPKSNENFPDSKPSCFAYLGFAKDSDAYKQIEKAIIDEASAVFKDKAKLVLQKLKANANQFILRDGDLKADVDGYADLFYLSCKNQNPVIVIDKTKTKHTEATNPVYRGCYVNAQVEIQAWVSKAGKEGISARILVVQFANDGDVLGGVATIGNVDAFDQLEESESLF